MEKNKKKGLNFWQVLLIVLTIALIILTLGWFIKNYSNSNEPTDDLPKKDDSEDETKIITSPNEEQIKDISKQLEDIEIRMAAVEKLQEEIITTERFIYTASRGVFGAFLIIANLLYLKFSMDWKIALDKQVDFNGAILLGYSFLAFVTYGTPTRLVSSLKKKTQYLVKQRFEEKNEDLNNLSCEKDRLAQLLKSLESR